MSKELKILVGISGSGKSTLAKQMFDRNPLTSIIVNRDKIRELLFGYTENSIWEYYYREDLGKLEKQVTLYEDTIIHEGLMQDKTVIVDATHLKKTYIERFRFWNVPTEIIYLDVPLSLAIERDSKRSRRVGEEVIKKQYNSYINLDQNINIGRVTLVQNTNLPSCVIFDVDGTLAHKGSRNAYDWKLVGNDAVDLPVSALYHNIEDKFITIVCTGRDGVCKEETLKWFDDNYLPKPTEFHIREENDMRPDWVVKEEMWRDISERCNILYIVDDRNQVCRRARSLGLKVFQVEYGNF